MNEYDTDDFEYSQDLLLCVDAEGFHYPPTQAEQKTTNDLYS